MRKTAVEEAQEEQSAHTNAAKECKAERAADATAFAELYGTNGNKRNAFGKCVSKKAKAKEHAADEQDAEDATEFKNAAKECDAERGDTEATRAAFADEVRHQREQAQCLRQVRVLEGVGGRDRVL